MSWQANIPKISSGVVGTLCVAVARFPSRRLNEKREFAALSREVETGEEERRRRAEGKRFEIAIANPVTPNNIRNALKDCASKPDADIAILYFSNGYADGLFKDGIGKYKGLAGTSKRKNFLKIYVYTSRYQKLRKSVYL